MSGYPNKHAEAIGSLELVTKASSDVSRRAHAVAFVESMIEVIKETIAAEPREPSSATRPPADDRMAIRALRSQLNEMARFIEVNELAQHAIAAFRGPSFLPSWLKLSNEAIGKADAILSRRPEGYLDPTYRSPGTLSGRSDG